MEFLAKAKPSVLGIVWLQATGTHSSRLNKTDLLGGRQGQPSQNLAAEAQLGFGSVRDRTGQREEAG